MLSLRTWLRVIVAAALGFALLQGGGAWASSFDVSPIRLPLSESTPTALLTVRNHSAEPARFQVTAFAWSQGPGGDMVLAPTQDLVVFPTLFSLKAGETRNMRIGTVVPFGGIEKSYRVFVEELPPNAANLEPGKVRVLTRMGVPVFLSPAGAAPAPALDPLVIQHNQLAFSLRNKGNAYFLTRRVRVTGVAADGRVVFTRELPAWYMLAGGLRAYELELPPEACTAARIEVDAEIASAHLTASVQAPPRACPR